jgi:peptide/nickel transport system permease protein/oligopeptide transport system permease protein
MMRLIKESWIQLRHNRMATIGAAIVLVLVLAATLAPVIAPFDPYEANLQESLVSPSLRHVMGTDYLGRDIFSRVLYGARISLQVGVLAELISLAIGISVGAIAAYYRGWVDQSVMRVADMFFAFPTALFAMAVIAVFEEPSITKIFIVLGIVNWAGVARLVRGSVLSIKEREFAEAARALGVRPRRLVVRHLLPNALAPVLVAATMGVAGNILTESWLSFLGLGAQAPLASWGSMITSGQPFIYTKPWVCLCPGLAIAVTVLGFNLFGDGLRDILDPRLARRLRS